MPRSSRLWPPRIGSGTVRHSERARNNPGIASTQNAACHEIMLAIVPQRTNPTAVPAISPVRMYP